MKAGSLIISGMMVLILMSCSQKEEKTPVAVPLDNQKARFSYAMGMDIGSNMRAMGVELDQAAFIDAIKASLNNGELRMSLDDARQVKQVTVQQKQVEEKGQKQEKTVAKRKANDDFFAQNAKKNGMKVTSSGLQYEVIKSGEGSHPKVTDTVQVNYVIKLLDGTEIENSSQLGSVATIALNAMIPGWSEGLQLMNQGSKYKLFIPARLAYGESSGGYAMEPNSIIVIETELVGIAGAEQVEAIESGEMH